MHRLLLIKVLALSIVSLPALAQKAPQEQSIIESRAGSATRTTTISASAVVKGIEKETRTLMLELPDGDVIEVVAGEGIRNFNQIGLNDEVVVEYTQSLSLTLQKVRSDDTDVTIGSAAARAEPGMKPAGGVGQIVQAFADVVAVSPEKGTITLKGPQGRIFELLVNNPDHFKVVNAGDQVLVTYTEAVAVSVEPANQPGS
ncbi:MULTISPECIES: hypothetical protein [unclassified Marinobacter]|uniref:hypothetical protein n=1 Tax=unclassified Marinobacter TaxID=83889 RepID=UPI001928C8F5|nr:MULTISPECIES: hypothetical protein [unclassified Marinobacter]MBL3827141.1 hypothetical protein [Marinobacter sp. MC3]MBL3895634.1 hypothetical protein [Marinobacter sp. MW3]